jgi:hypothetical protein
MKKQNKKPKRRALYKYICSGCGKKRDSLVYDRATGEVCTVCKRNQVPENQSSLFDSFGSFDTNPYEKGKPIIGKVEIKKVLSKNKVIAKIL